MSTEAANTQSNTQSNANANDRQPLLPIPANPNQFPLDADADQDQEEWRELTRILSLLAALLAMLLSIVFFAHQVHRHHHGPGVDNGASGRDDMMVAEMWKRHVEDVFQTDPYMDLEPQIKRHNQRGTRVMEPKRTRTVSVVSLL